MSEVITITSGKGGTGKSTVCAGLGCAAAAEGKKTIIIEMDFGFACLDLFFGIQNKVRFDLSDIVGGSCRAEEAVIHIPNFFGLDLICAPENPYEELNHKQLAEIIEALKKTYDYIIIDTGAGLSRSIACAAEITDMLIFVATPDPISVRDAAKLSCELKGFDCSQRLVVNKVSRKALDMGLIKNLDGVIDDTGIQLIGVVPDDDAVIKAFGNGTALSKHSPSYVAFSAISRRIGGDMVPLTIN